MPGRIIKKGVKAYFDSIIGLIPCKVLSVHGDRRTMANTTIVEIEFTGNNRCWQKGDRFKTHALHVVPPKALRKTKYYTMIGSYVVQGDDWHEQSK